MWFRPESQLEVLRNRIQGRMKMAPQRKPYTWKSVRGCALMGTDMLWYRAHVLEVLREMVKVRGVLCTHYPTDAYKQTPQIYMHTHK